MHDVSGGAGTFPTVSVVIPARNEARNLEPLLARLPDDYEIVLVDGHSVDDTVAVACETRPDVHVVRQTRIGKGNALACGFLAATGEVIVMFDADGSADPDEIPRFVAALAAGADFAKGSRCCAKGGSEDLTRLRAFGNASMVQLANRLFGTTYTDLCYGYNAFWRDLVPLLGLPSIDTLAPSGVMLWGDGFEIETVINCRIAVADLRVTEVPSVERSRWHGTSNLHVVRDGMRVLHALLSERRRMAQYRRHCEAVTRSLLPRRDDIMLGWDAV